MKAMTEREAMLKQLSAFQFAALDLQLYLDTHPGDEKALEQMRGYVQKAKDLKKQYEKRYGALTKRGDGTNGWNWIKAPWPWETEDDC